MKLNAQFIIAGMLALSASTAASAATLQEAVKSAVENHPEVKIAAKNRSAIKQEWRQAKAGYMPTADLTLGSGHERSNNNTTRARAGRNAEGAGGHRSLWRNEAQLSVSQMLFDGFATDSNVCQQKARYSSAGHNVNEIMETTGLRAVQAYLDVMRTKELVGLANTNVKNHEVYMDQIKKRSSGGRGSQADVRQAEGRLALAQANLISAQGDYKNAKADYLEVVGERADDLSKSKAPVAGLPQNLEEALERAMANNPAILSAQYDIKAAGAAHRGAKANFYPRLDLELDATRQQNLDGLPGANNEYQAMARVRYNLYRGGADMARKRERSERLAEAHEQLARDKRTVEENMYNAWNDLTTSRARITPLSTHVTSSDQTRKAYKQQFDLGQRSLLDLLDSEIEVFNARSALINGKYAVDFAVYEVLANAGDLADTILGDE